MKKQNDVIEKIRAALYLKKTQINAKTALASLARDSMDIIELIAILQNEYGISVKPADLQSLKTVADLVMFIEKHENSKKDSSIAETL